MWEGDDGRGGGGVNTSTSVAMSASFGENYALSSVFSDGLREQPFVRLVFLSIDLICYHIN